MELTTYTGEQAGKPVAQLRDAYAAAFTAPPFLEPEEQADLFAREFQSELGARALPAVPPTTKSTWWTGGGAGRSGVAEFGDDPGRYASAKARTAYAGTAPSPAPLDCGRWWWPGRLATGG